MNEWMNESWHQSIRVMHNQFRSIPKSIPLLIIAVLHCIELVPEFAFIWRSQSFEWLIRTSPNLHWWPHPADGFNSNCGECDAVFCCCLLKRGSFPPFLFMFLVRIVSLVTSPALWSNQMGQWRIIFFFFILSLLLSFYWPLVLWHFPLFSKFFFCCSMMSSIDGSLHSGPISARLA